MLSKHGPSTKGDLTPRPERVCFAPVGSDVGANSAAASFIGVCGADGFCGELCDKVSVLLFSLLHLIGLWLYWLFFSCLEVSSVTS